MKLRTDLIIAPFSFLGCTINILVNSSSVDQGGINVEVFVLRRVRRDVVTLLERSLDKIRPLLVRYKSFLAIN